MPSASPSPTESTSQGSILLIEEYDALAAAISSALHKFAPSHEVHVARNLNEAEALAETSEHALLVIDFDPPFSGLSPFLQKLEKHQPDTRVLMMAGKMSSDVGKAARSVNALQFVEKPFDVPDFGAAVQALLGPWRESETATSRGTLHDLSVADLVVAQCAGARTLAVEVSNGEGKSGEIHLRQGIPFHAATGKKFGNEALREIFEWRDVEVRERERAHSTRRTIQAGWSDIVADIARKTKPQPVRPARKAASTPPPKAGPKLVVVDDTEMLLIFVEDMLMTSGGNYQITTATTGMAGVKEVERAKPDLVLCDYSLPDINGDEVCRRLLQHDATSRIPVLMMSGHVAEMSKAAANLDNVVATIEKPFLGEALVSLVGTVLAEGRKVNRKPSARKTTAPAKPAKEEPVATPPPPPPVSPAEHQPSPRSKSMVAKAKRAIGQLRRQVAPESAAPETTPASPAPPAVEKQPAFEMPYAAIPAAPGGTDRNFSTRIVSEGPNEVILSLYLDVMSVQLTPELRMGAIRARPSSAEVSLHVISGNGGNLPETGFKLGPVGLDEQGRLATMRLIPTQAPVKTAAIHSDLQIGGVTVVPIDSTTRMQLTPAANAPMTLQLLAHLELAGVELSPTFQVSQILLKDQGRPIRVTMNGTGHEPNGTACETLDILLDRSAQIKELLLNPVK